MRQFKPKVGNYQPHKGKSDRYASGYFHYDYKIHELSKIKRKLNDWEISFIESIKYVKELTFKQKACINRMYDKFFIVKVIHTK